MHVVKLNLQDVLTTKTVPVFYMLFMSLLEFMWLQLGLSFADLVQPQPVENTDMLDRPDYSSEGSKPFRFE